MLFPLILGHSDHYFYFAVEEIETQWLAQDHIAPGFYWTSPLHPHTFVRAQSAHAFLCISSQYTDYATGHSTGASWSSRHSVFLACRSLAQPGRLLLPPPPPTTPPPPTSPQRCGMRRHCHSPVREQESGRFVSHLPRKQNLADMQVCPTGRMATSPAMTCRRPGACLSHQPPYQQLGCLTYFRATGRREASCHQGSLSIKTSSVMSKAEGWNLVNFIIFR